MGGDRLLRRRARLRTAVLHQPHLGAQTERQGVAGVAGERLVQTLVGAVGLAAHQVELGQLHQRQRRVGVAAGGLGADARGLVPAVQLVERGGAADPRHERGGTRALERGQRGARVVGVERRPAAPGLGVVRALGGERVVAVAGEAGVVE